MDICYYNSQIKDELDGAADYIKRAIHCKAQNPARASKFAKMSQAELGHADELVAMFQEDYKSEVTDQTAGILAAVRNSIFDMYTEFSAKVKYMHETYQSK